MTGEEVQRHIDEFNEKAKTDALEDFSEQIGREMALSCDCYAPFAANCTEAIRNRRVFEPFGEFDSDEIARIYSTDTVVSYDGYDLDMSDRPLDSEDWRDHAIAQTWYADIEEAYHREVFIDSFEKYLETAAKTAKSIKSDAEGPYLEALALSKDTKTEYSRLSLSGSEALKLVHLEKNAAQTLLGDLNKFNGKKS